MRIAFLVGVFPRISEAFIVNQIVGLLESGHEVDIFAGKKGPLEVVHSDVYRLNLLDRCIFPRPWFHPSSLLAGLRYPAALPISVRYGSSCSLSRLLPTLADCGRGRRYDIIQAHFGGHGLKAVALRQLGALQGRIVTTFHGHDATSYPRTYGRDCYRALFANGDWFFGVSQHLVQLVCELGCPPEKISKLPMGIRPSDFPFRARTYRAGEPIRLLTVARLVEKKGLEYSIRAVAQVARDFPMVQYQIIGEGGLRGELDELIQKLGVQDRIHLVGARSQDEVRRACDASHLFILASVTAKSGDQEGLGMSVQEAQSSGMPILATRHGGIPDGVLDGQSGFLVPERDAEALAERLSFLLSHPELWPEMGRAGRQLVEERFDQAKLTRQLIEVYQRLLAN